MSASLARQGLHAQNPDWYPGNVGVPDSENPSPASVNGPPPFGCAVTGPVVTVSGSANAGVVHSSPIPATADIDWRTRFRIRPLGLRLRNRDAAAVPGTSTEDL